MMANFTPCKLAYNVVESASGTDKNLSPVIFMHGLTGSKEHWEDIVQIVADKTKRKVYAYDARNHGDSEHTDVFNFDLNVDDLFHFMDTMNIQKAVLVGHSMGSLTATNAALRKPERVEKLFSEDMFVKKLTKEIIGPIAGVLQMFVQTIRSTPKNLNETEAIQYTIDAIYDQLPKELTKNFDKEKMSNQRFIIKRTPEGGYDVKFNVNAVLRAINDLDSLMTEPSGQFNGPACFIYGDLSMMNVKKEEDHIKKHFPNAELVEFTGANHNVHGEFPEKYVETILQRL